MEKEMVKKEILEKIKLRLDIKDDSADPLIEEYIEEVEQKILTMTNRKALPVELIHVLKSIVCEKYKDLHTEPTVVEEKEGNASYKYRNENYNKVTGAGGADYIRNYKDEIIKYRVLRRR